MIHIILAPSTSEERIGEFERRLQELDLRIVDSWKSENGYTVKIAVNAHTVAQMRNTDILARRFFEAECIDCHWLY